MLPEHVRRSALLVLVQELQVLRIWRCGFQSFKVEEGRFQLPFNIFTSSCQARTGKLLSGIHIRRKQWITSKGESLRPDGTWNLLEPDRPDGVLQYVAIRCNQCVHVRPCASGKASESRLTVRGTMLPCLMCWSMKRSMCLRASASQSISELLEWK